MNRKRLKRRLINQIINSSPRNRSSHHKPQKINQFLFIEVQKGWGDFLYFLGLLKALHETGVIIDVATLPETVDRYKRVPFIRNVLNIQTPSEIETLTSRTYDVALDITYIDAKLWKLRLPLLKKLNCHTITTGPLFAKSSLFDEFIDISHVAHWSERLAVIYNSLISPYYPAKRSILPYFYSIQQTKSVASFLSKLNPNKKYIYVNTQSGSSDRSLSDIQIQKIVEIFNTNKNFIGIFYASTAIRESDNVIALPNMSFEELYLILQSCIAIITPDTSIVHLGSILNIPVLGFYCGNYRDYWSKYPQVDTWRPLSKRSIVYLEDDVDIADDSDFIYTHRKKPVSSYSVSTIEHVIQNFFDKLLNPEFSNREENTNIS